MLTVSCIGLFSLAVVYGIYCVVSGVKTEAKEDAEYFLSAERMGVSKAEAERIKYEMY